MNNKRRALFEVTIMYIIIAILGWITYDLFNDAEPLMRFIYADLVMTVATFIFSLIKRNSSVYDPYWSIVPFFFILIWFIYFGGADWESYQWVCNCS